MSHPYSLVDEVLISFEHTTHSPHAPDWTFAAIGSSAPRKLDTGRTGHPNTHQRSHLDPAEVQMDLKSREELLSCGDWNQIYAHFMSCLFFFVFLLFFFFMIRPINNIISTVLAYSASDLLLQNVSTCYYSFWLVDAIWLRTWIDNNIHGPLTLFSHIFPHIFSFRCIPRTANGSVQHGLRLGLPGQGQAPGQTTIVPWNTMGVWWDWTT